MLNAAMLIKIAFNNYIYLLFVLKPQIQLYVRSTIEADIGFSVIGISFLHNYIAPQAMFLNGSHITTFVFLLI